MGGRPTSVCDQAGEQHEEEEEEEVPGCRGCVWFLHMLLRPLFGKWVKH